MISNVLKSVSRKRWEWDIYTFEDTQSLFLQSRHVPYFTAKFCSYIKIFTWYCPVSLNQHYTKTATPQLQ